jgi:potassium-transporting ATPase potassium-binding subunit
MLYNNLFQIVVLITLLVIVCPFLGYYIYTIFSKEENSIKNINKYWHPLYLFSKIELLIYKICKVDKLQNMDWKKYLFSVLIFNFFGFVLLFILQMIQKWLPLNPQNLGNVPIDLAFNTAVSFVTNTNWQNYAGETTMSYFVQMVGLTVQNFLSAGTGIVVVIALIRGIANKESNHLGNFWVDITRSVVYILIPLSIVISILLISQGVVQTLQPYQNIETVEGVNQTIPLGPAASQVAIKMVGTNGGGYFNANSSHPFENPTPFSNFIEMFSLLMIPMSLPFTFGRLVGSKKQGRTLFLTMFGLLLIGFLIMLFSENYLHPILQQSGIMEGKETRFGVVNSVFFANITTAVSCGAVNCAHSSLTPISGLILMLNMMLGEIIFGGVGAGLYGMLIFVLLTVFISGLMVGRTPEYLGKKIESKEIKMAILAVIIPNMVILIFTALALCVPSAYSQVSSGGPHSFSEILYAFTSSAANNGSAFAGLNGNTPFFNIFLGLSMIIGRFGVIIPVLIIAGSLSNKKIIPKSLGTFRTDTPLFAFILIAVILIIGALTYFPALSLGPILEHLLMKSGIIF